MGGRGSFLHRHHQIVSVSASKLGGFLAKLASWLGNKMALLKILTLGKLTAMSRLESKIRGSCKGQLVTTPPTELWLPNLEVRTLKSELSGLVSESLIGGGRHAEKKSLILGPVGSHPGSVVPPPPYLLGSLVLACQSRTGSLPPILVVSGVFRFCSLSAN